MGRPTWTMAAKTKMIKDWNDRYPVGTEVIVWKDDGTAPETKTTSEAQLLGGHTPVIFLEGISGAYALHRVRAKEVKRAAP